MEKVVIFSAPSGSGKTTLIKHCLEVFSQLEFSISATTRQARKDEIHKKDYYFLGYDEFKKKISENAFIEYEEVYSNIFYGTLKSEIERIWNKNKIVIFDVDVKGGINLKNFFGQKAISIFIIPPSIEVLKKRLINRNSDSLENINLRLDRVQEELAYRKYFDKVVINDDLDFVKKEVEKLIMNFISIV